MGTKIVIIVFSFSQKCWENCKIWTLAIVFTMHMVVACGFHWTELETCANSSKFQISCPTFSRSLQSMETLEFPYLSLHELWLIVYYQRPGTAPVQMKTYGRVLFVRAHFHLKRLLSRIIRVISVEFKHCRG